MIRVVHLWKDVRLFHGVHQQLLTLARHIDRTEFEMLVCILGNPCEPISRQFEEAGIAVHYLRMERLQSPLLIPRLVRLLRTVSPDILQTYCPNPNVFGGISAWLARVPSVISGELTNRDQAPSRLQRARDRLLTPLNNAVSDRATARVFISEAVKRDWVGARSSPKYSIIHPAFDSSKSANGSRRGGDRQRPIIGIVARLSEEKRHTDLIHAMKIVTASLPAALLLVVGDGPLDRVLKRETAELNLTQNVTFTGYRRDVFDALSMMDIFVMPSRSEGLGISILEAMASGLPVVATNVGGIPEAVVDGKTGILVPPFQPAALAEAILHLVKHPAEASRMGEAGRNRVRQQFSPKSFVARHEQLYRQVYAKGKVEAPA